MPGRTARTRRGGVRDRPLGAEDAVARAAGGSSPGGGLRRFGLRARLRRVGRHRSPRPRIADTVSGSAAVGGAVPRRMGRCGPSPSRMDGGSCGDGGCRLHACLERRRWWRLPALKVCCATPVAAVHRPDRWASRAWSRSPGRGPRHAGGRPGCPCRSCSPSPRAGLGDLVPGRHGSGRTLVTAGARASAEAAGAPPRRRLACARRRGRRDGQGAGWSYNLDK